MTQTAKALPDWTLTDMLAVAVIFGGSLGAHIGAVRLPPVALQRLLASILLFAAFKLLKSTVSS